MRFKSAEWPASVLKVFHRLPRLFWLPAAIGLGLCLAASFSPAGFATVLEQLNTLVFNYFGSFYLWFGFLTLLVFLAIGVSPLGNIRLGGQNATPEYTFFSWVGLLFTTGMGTGIMFWGAAEPLYHFMNPPVAHTTGTLDRAMWAFHYTFLHWSFIPWSIYGMTALGLGFLAYNCNHPVLANLLQPNRATVQGEEGRKGYFLIGLWALLAILFGISATYAMGVIQLEGGLTALFHLPGGIGVTLGLVVLMAAIYVTAALTGLKKGIQFISDGSVWVYLTVLALVFILGPKTSLFGAILRSVPQFIERFPAMSLGYEHFNSPRWADEWTVKYWSWWIAWTPFVGLFLAKISRGRTIRALVIASVLIPSLFCCLWFIVFGQCAIALQIQQQFVGPELTLQETSSVLFILIRILWNHPILACLCLFTIALDFINSADSATYTVASLSQTESTPTPPVGLQLAWGLLFAGLASLLLMAGGIQPIQQITLITTLPFTMVMGALFLLLIPQLVRYYTTTTNNGLPICLPSLPNSRSSSASIE